MIVLTSSILDPFWFNFLVYLHHCVFLIVKENVGKNAPKMYRLTKRYLSHA